MVAEPPRPAGFSIAMSNPAQRSGDRLLAQQTALARFGELALHSDDLQAILHDACRLVAEGLGTGLAKVLELSRMAARCWSVPASAGSPAWSAMSR
jgi:hypothetical protein